MIQYYADNIFDLTKSSIKSSYATILVGVLSIVGCVVSIGAVDKTGRRVLLTLSLFVMSISLFVFVAYVILVVENGERLGN